MEAVEKVIADVYEELQKSFVDKVHDVGDRLGADPTITNIISGQITTSARHEYLRALYFITNKALAAEKKNQPE